MLSPHLEYALGEYGLFEYGHETVGLPFVADFAILGEGEITTHVVIDSNTDMVSEGNTQVGMKLSTVTHTVLDGHAESSTDIVGQMVHQRIGYFRGRSEVIGEVGNIVFREFFIKGKSEAYIYPIEGYEFLSYGRTSLWVDTEVDAYVDAFSSGTVDISFEGDSINEIEMYIAGYSSDSIKNYQINTSALVSGGVGKLHPISSAFSNVRYSGSGIAIVKPRIQGVNQSELTSKGVAVLTLVGFAKQFIPTSTNTVGHTFMEFVGRQITQTSYFGTSSATVDTTTAHVYLGHFTSQGNTYVAWLRGNHVLVSMEPAYHGVIRPYEDRSIRWKQ